jgi:hypothetical protein
MGHMLRTNVYRMSKSEKKPAKKAPAKKAVAKKTAPAKKAPAKKTPAKKAPAKKSAPNGPVPNKKAPVKRQATSATPADITTSVSGTISEDTTTHTIINNVVRANDVQTPSLRKRMLRWFTKK